MPRKEKIKVNVVYVPENANSLSGHLWYVRTNDMHKYGLPELEMEHVPTVWVTSAHAMMEVILNEFADDLKHGESIKLDHATVVRVDRSRNKYWGKRKAFTLVPTEPVCTCSMCKNGKDINTVEADA